MATAVIIPARNEESTIFDIVRTFQDHPETRNNVYVGVDAATTDKTAQRVLDAEGVPIPFADVHGKGQVVMRTASALARAGMIPGDGRIILCDGDYTGLNTGHIEELYNYQRGMVIGVPDWPEIDVPEHVTNAWPMASGLRYLPYTLIPPDAHGYLLETQLNLAAIHFHLPVRTVFMDGLKSPFQWPLAPKRMAALQADKEWGTLHGVL
jgi:hypothetical protein